MTFNFNNDEFFEANFEDVPPMGIPMNVRFQDASQRDKQALMKLDLKCYDYSMSDEEWTQILSSAPANNPIPNSLADYQCATYRIDGKIVGYYIFDNKPDEGEHLELLRLGVHPEYRQRGYGTLLIDNARTKANSQGLREIEIVIPEYWLDPQEERGIIQFVDTAGLTPEDHKRDLYYHYGKQYDGILYRSGGRRKPDFVSA